MNKQQVKCLFGYHDFIDLDANRIPAAIKNLYTYSPYSQYTPINVCSGCGLCRYNTQKGKYNKISYCYARFDHSGRQLLYRKWVHDDTEEWYKYNDKGQLMHFRKSDGINVEYDYSCGKVPKQKVYNGTCTELT